jgi:4-amino-4-deoxy-L-arabinose transferase-like glycosyltransferase
VFLSFFPWSIKLPWLTKRLRANRDPTDNYLIAGTLVVFLIFTLVKTKLLHYTLPAFPLLSLLLAGHLVGTRFLKTAAVTMTIVYLAIALVGFPIASRAFPTPQLFNLARSDLRPEMEFGAVDYVEPSLVWYFRSRTRGWLTTLDPATVKIFMDAPGARFVVLPTSLAGKLYPQLPPSWKSYRTSGVNFVKGKRVDLTMLLKPS